MVTGLIGSVNQFDWLCIVLSMEGKLIGAGAATIALAGAAIGIGDVFSSLIDSVSRNPSLAKQLFGYAILGFALTEAIASFATMMAFLILSSCKINRSRYSKNSFRSSIGIGDLRFVIETDLETNSVISVSRNLSLEKQLFGYAILGFALTEAIASFAPMMAFLILSL